MTEPTGWRYSQSPWIKYFTMNNWISVRDRLPEKQTAVLVARNGEIGVCYLYGSSQFSESDITHWMPLPEPPPPPDPFDEWYDKMSWFKQFKDLNRTLAREIWDAAIASTRK